VPTFTYDERVAVCKAMDAGGAVACPRCGSGIETHRLQTTQDKVLKRPGKPLYRCGNPKCGCECTPVSYLTIPPAGPSSPRPPTPPAAPPKPN
jgi:hypothetical protein